jgi:galactokinase
MVPRESVHATVEEQFGAGRDPVVARAPGRVNLVGGHVDYNDGLVLPCAIDRETVAAVRPRDDDRVRVHSVRMDETVTAGVGDDVTGWAAYVVGVVTVLSAAAGRDLGVDVVVDGDMVLGAGLSSSASLEVAVAGAVDAVYDLDFDRESLATACWRAENEEVGMACGLMDQFTAALARAGHALRIDCRSRDVERIPFDDGAARILVADTNVKHELTDSGYNDRVRECDEAVARLDALLDGPVDALRDVSPEELRAHADDLEPPLDRRARHVTGEIERVEAATEALRSGDVERVGALMRDSHRSLREDYEVSCAELDAVVEALDDRPEVYGGRMVGGGWGGSVVALVRPSATAAVAAAVEERYRTATGLDADTYVVAVGDGLRVAE